MARASIIFLSPASFSEKLKYFLLLIIIIVITAATTTAAAATKREFLISHHSLSFSSPLARVTIE